MAEVRQTEEFSGWLHRLRDANAVARIVGRIRRMKTGNPGDTRGVGLRSWWKNGDAQDNAI
jgi:putative component of toxin-antitoxin plasmid stabilization module